MCYMLTVVQSHLVPSVPIIDSVNAMTLSLFAFRVNITLLTDGGQSVTNYTVSVHVWMYVYMTMLAYTLLILILLHTLMIVPLFDVA